MANPEHVEVVKQGAEAVRRWREEHPNESLDLSGTDLDKTDLSRTNLRVIDLRVADLRDTDFTGANLYQAHLNGADLRGAWLSTANLGGARLGNANIARAWLDYANLSRTMMDGVRGAEHAYYLETVRFIPGESNEALGSSDDALYFEDCRRPWPEHWLDWERLRVVGRLPLFGLSYTALILIPVVFYGLALYNDKIDLVRAWAAQAVTSPDHPLHRLAPLLLERLHPQPLPSLSLLLLASTVLLAVGSSLYTFFCPSRIKEFSRDQWCDQHGHPLLHYWPFAWKHRHLRLACATCYALGGVSALWVLSTKLWHTGLFIWRHSTWSWW
jgi:hypothetical protein